MAICISCLWDLQWLPSYTCSSFSWGSRRRAGATTPQLWAKRRKCPPWCTASSGSVYQHKLSVWRPCDEWYIPPTTWPALLDSPSGPEAPETPTATSPDIWGTKTITLSIGDIANRGPTGCKNNNNFQLGSVPRALEKLLMQEQQTVKKKSSDRKT